MPCALAVCLFDVFWCTNYPATKSFQAISFARKNKLKALANPYRHGRASFLPPRTTICRCQSPILLVVLRYVWRGGCYFLGLKIKWYLTHLWEVVMLPSIRNKQRRRICFTFTLPPLCYRYPPPLLLLSARQIKMWTMAGRVHAKGETGCPKPKQAIHYTWYITCIR